MRARLGRWVNGTRRLAPAGFVPVVVGAKARLARRRASPWADARDQMRYVVGDQADGVIDELAAAYLARMVWRGESRWHPQLLTRQRVSGAEHLQALRDRGTPYILSFTHHGDYEGLGPSLGLLGFPVHTVATSAMFQPTMPAWMEQQKRVAESNGVTLIDVAHGSAGIRKVLDAGHPVAMATDVAGRTPARYLGHDVGIAAGGSRIALEMGLPVLPVTSHQDPDRPNRCAVLRVWKPFEAEDFGSAQELLTTLLSLHEGAVRAWPQATEYPRRRLESMGDKIDA